MGRGSRFILNAPDDRKHARTWVGRIQDIDGLLKVQSV